MYKSPCPPLLLFTASSHTASGFACASASSGKVESTAQTIPLAVSGGSSSDFTARAPRRRTRSLRPPTAARRTHGSGSYPDSANVGTLFSGDSATSSAARHAPRAQSSPERSGASWLSVSTGEGAMRPSRTSVAISARGSTESDVDAELPAMFSVRSSCW